MSSTEDRSNGKDSSVLTTFIIAIAVGTVAFVFFLIARKRWQKFYHARHFAGRPTPTPIPDSLFGWVKPTLKCPEQQMVDTHGLDAVMYLRYLKSMGLAFAIIFVIAWALLVPLNMTGSNKDRPDDDPLKVTGLRKLGTSNINTETSDKWRLFAHLACVFIFSAIVMFFLTRDYRMFVKYRIQIKSAESMRNYSVMVRDIPYREPRKSITPSTADNVVAAHFGRLFPGKVSQAYVATAAPCMSKRLEKFRELTTELEKAEFAYEKKGKRPTKRAFLCCGQKKDLIDDISEKRQKEWDRIATLDREAQKVTRVGFVIFVDKITAALAHKALLHRKVSRWNTDEGPDPKDVCWSNLGISHLQQLLRRIVITLFIVALLLLWTIPVSAAAALANIDTIRGISSFSWLADAIDAMGPVVQSIVQGFLPVLVVMICMIVIRIILNKAAEMRGFYLFSKAAMVARNYYLAFIIVNVFITYTVGGTFFAKASTFTDAENTFSTFIDILAVSIPAQAIFYSNYIMTSALMSWPLAAVIIGGLLKRGFVKWRKPSRRQMEEVDDPKPFDFGTFTAVSVLIFILGIFYSVLFPFVLIPTVLYFWVGFVICKYLIVWVCAEPFEMRGRMWPVMFSISTLGLLIYQTAMLLIFLTYRFWAAPALGLAILGTLMWYFHMRKKYKPPATYGSLEQLQEGRKAEMELSVSRRGSIDFDRPVYVQPEKRLLAGEDTRDSLRAEAQPGTMPPLAEV